MSYAAYFVLNLIGKLSVIRMDTQKRIGNFLSAGKDSKVSLKIGHKCLEMFDNI